MGTGKTTNGRRVARKLHKEFIDTDFLIESKEGMSIDEIFKKHGEGYFRKLESRIVKEVSTKKNKVISTGGGTILNPKNVQLLKRNGYIFLLESSIDNIIYNLKNSYKKRPLLEKKDWTNEVVNILNRRHELYYNSADFIIRVDNKNHFHIVNEISKIYFRNINKEINYKHKKHRNHKNNIKNR
ncbi:shikimate kinase [Clostridium sp. D2Q-11]|uniref:Shikimate kinase n=1 Tax=Anaeromonas frigoriresistens TaxID=2683708 RepID=A0A942V175_9FIRM|nr:shikimate kinase [Anaeromonas frigoriresistens]MBS4540001.1 shikimate kinase [Anaeromonas frigoriresistens]